MSKPLSAKAGPYTPSRGHFAGQTFASYRQYQNANAKAKIVSRGVVYEPSRLLG